jgi:large subunit ribosomal protein L2
MTLVQKNPLTPSQRFQIADNYDDLTKFTPEKSLLRKQRKTSGRDNRGRISMRHRGGGNRQHYRIVDFKRIKDNIPAKVAGIEYDPNRNCRLALLVYTDGEKRYILAPLGIQPGDILMSGPEAEIKLGNTLPLQMIPVGTNVHCLELTPGKGAQLGRGAGAMIQLVGKDGAWAIVRLPSGEQRKVPLACRATIGQIGNLDHANIRMGKAGKMRHLGRRPMVRGVVMNPCDHKHGGGEGKSGIGGKHPVSPWGQPSLGFKTRGKKVSEKYILMHRKRRNA